MDWRPVFSLLSCSGFSCLGCGGRITPATVVLTQAKIYRFQSQAASKCANIYPTDGTQGITSCLAMLPLVLELTSDMETSGVDVLRTARPARVGIESDGGWARLTAQHSIITYTAATGFNIVLSKFAAARPGLLHDATVRPIEQKEPKTDTLAST
ncbi:hypothetical protein B0H13DRAFT_1899952 [Mycena leptocephala]|nr:hypothetical protein B0H13DRAFT_1899952 [Mycena leptocephala]